MTTLLRGPAWTVCEVRNAVRAHLTERLECKSLSDEDRLFAYEEAIMYITGIEGGLARLRNKLEDEAKRLLDKHVDDSKLWKDKP